MSSADEVDQPDRVRAAGERRRRVVQGAKSDSLMTALGDIDQRLVEWSDTFVFGQVWADSTLSHEEQTLVAIAALAAGGNVLQLRAYFHGALQAGIDPEKIQDALVMLVVYVGFPTTLTVLDEWSRVRASHERRQSSKGDD